MYKNNILLAVTGKSPQVVTETLYAIYQNQDEFFLPDQVKLITTKEGAKAAVDNLLNDGKGHFFKFLEEYGLQGKIKFEKNDITIIKDKDGKEINDLIKEEHNTAAADLITKAMRLYTKNNDTRLHVSLAGGRKTMSYYLGSAYQFFAREQDVLSHVLVSPIEFESNNFYYIPKLCKAISVWDKATETTKEIFTDNANIKLLKVPVVKLRHGVAEQFLNRNLSFEQAVEIVEDSYKAPNIKLDIGAKKLFCGGKEVKLPLIQLVIYTHILKQSLSNVKVKIDETFFEKLVKTGQDFYEGQGEARVKLKEFSPYDANTNLYAFYDRFESERSKIKATLKEELWVSYDKYTINHFGKRPARAYSIDVPKKEITIISTD